MNILLLLANNNASGISCFPIIKSKFYQLMLFGFEK